MPVHPTSLTRLRILIGNRTRRNSQDRTNNPITKPAKAKIRPYKRFQNFAKSVRIIVTACIAVRKEVSAKSGGLSLAEFQTDIEATFSESLAFHPLYIVKKQEPKGSEILKKLLDIPADRRTDAIIDDILSHVRRLKSFTMYSNTLQRQLCQVLRYESYGKRRVIVQQGHLPIAYYFILSGTLLVNITDSDIRTNQPFTRTVQEIGEGKSFGEVALINGSSRTATIVSKAFVELLAIDKEDFQKTIYHTFLQEKHANLQFLKTLKLFELWPVKILYNRADSFSYHHYRPESVIVQNSNDSRWIAIVKEGKCKVVCKIKRPALNQGKVRIHSSKPKYSTYLPTLRPLPVEASKHIVVDGPDKDRLDPATQLVKDEDVIMQESDTNMFQRYGQSEEEANRRKKYVEILHKMGNAHAGHFRKRSLSEPPLPTRQHMPMIKRKLVLQKNKGSYTRRTQKKSIFPPVQEQTDDMFVQVSILRSGGIFGLQSIVNRNAVETALISEGAEIILVSKQLFLKEASKSVLTILENLTIQYPSEVALQRELQEQQSWHNFKRSLITDIMEYSKECKDVNAYLNTIMHS
ncbi:Cyclic nucleotide-binding domain-containing protein 2 [Trichoplax sp. H2]|nr:Cyclic nucleotide-binding domain-containing protein 2 [Trichoplax sp. H2]|eukprot:RDD41392.1 Cyclic nucleotide-binding domain-containing protein 2 [Trichoplax sp. H2]